MAKIDQQPDVVLKEAVSQPPTEQNYNFTYWKVPLLAGHNRQTLAQWLFTETLRITLHS